MKLFRRSTAVHLALPLTLIVAFLADEVAFHPAAGSSVAKELSIDVELGLDDVSVSVNGDELPPEMLGQLGDEKLIVSILMGVTEKFVATKDGRPTDLLRTFDELSIKAQFGEDSKETDGGENLQGKTVRFHWNEDEQRYDKSWHESTGDAEKLDALTEDMDLRLLLPTKKVSEGDTWEVAGDRLAPLFLPGGIAGGDDDSEETAAAEDEIRAQLATFLKDFKVVCKYAGQRDDGDVRVAEITFTFEGTPKIDMGPVIERVAQAQGEVPDADVTATLSAKLKGEGKLDWNQAAGHMHAFEMQSELELELDLSADANEEGQSFQLEIGAKASGQVTWKMSAKRL